MKVFVVIGCAGEYADRDTWVSGVFLSRTEAEACIAKRAEAHRFWCEWYARRGNHLKLSSVYRKPYSEMYKGEYEAAVADAERVAGPKPDREAGEEFEIVEITIGEWRGHS